MKRQRVEYTPELRESPMTFWVHGGAGDAPPTPKPVAGKGYARYFVEFDGFEFTFASLDELRVCVDVLGQRNLSTSTRLAAEHGSSAGPNSHWLSRLPADVKSWRYREPAVAYLRKALADFEAGHER